MKKFLILVLIILVILTVGCLDNYVPREEYNSKLVELEEANSKIDTNAIEITGLKREINILENDLDLSNEEIDKYNNLIGNLNELLSCVYYGYASNDKWILDGFTAFSMEYNGKYYLITAGHSVENEYGKFGNFKFKANFTDKWIYPKLLVYNNDYLNRNDYAIFYSDKISNGFIIDNENDNPKYILGTENQNLNIIRNFNINGIEGESGSPIVDYEGEISGMSTTDMSGYFTKIYTIIEAIDNLE